MEKIAFLGAGSWATALAQVLADKGYAPVLWSIVEKDIIEINTRHTNTTYFGEDIHLSERITATGDLAEAVTGADYVVLAVPSGAIRSVLTQALAYLNEGATIVNLAKGFDPTTRERMSCTIYNILGARKNRVVTLIGPSHAEEVVARKITSVCAVSEDAATAEQVQNVFSGSYFRLYVTTDVIGAEYGAAMKNIIALASGIVAGQGDGDNAMAALVTRGLHEMISYGTAKGGEKDTFFGLTGVGDLIATCVSTHSRNYQAGREIGRADDATEFLATNTKTVEGIAACKYVAEDARAIGIDMPIISAVYEVLYEGQKPSDVIRRIMKRPLRAEGFEDHTN